MNDADMLSGAPRTLVSDAIALDADRELFRSISRHERLKRFQVGCTHQHLTVLDSSGSMEDDHETQNCKCDTCGGFFVATIWKIDRPTELTAMSAAMAARYAEWKV